MSTQEENHVTFAAGCRTAGRKGRACRDRGFPQEPREVYAGRARTLKVSFLKDPPGNR